MRKTTSKNVKKELIKCIIIIFVILQGGLQLQAATNQLGKPQIKVAFYPIYPREQLLNGDVGSAKVLFLLNEKGRVSKAKVDESSHPAFAEAALRAIKSWRFAPFMVDGKPVAVKMRQPFRFEPSTEAFFSLEHLKRYQKGIQLQPLEACKPAYPIVLKKDQIRGHCDVIISVDEMGKVFRSRIEQSSHPAFEESALEAASGWEFTPFRRMDNFEKIHGKKADYVNESYGRIKLRLTLLFQPNLSESMEVVQHKIIREPSYYVQN